MDDSTRLFERLTSGRIGEKELLELLRGEVDLGEETARRFLIELIGIRSFVFMRGYGTPIAIAVSFVLLLSFAPLTTFAVKVATVGTVGLAWFLVMNHLLERARIKAASVSEVRRLRAERLLRALYQYFSRRGAPTPDGS